MTKQLAQRIAERIYQFFSNNNFAPVVTDVMVEYIVMQAREAKAPMSPFEMNLTLLRGAGWSVAVHNDYRLNGKRMTFWLMTQPNGRWLKGEGETDEEALSQIVDQVRRG